MLKLQIWHTEVTIQTRRVVRRRNRRKYASTVYYLPNRNRRNLSTARVLRMAGIVLLGGLLLRLLGQVALGLGV